MPASTPPVRTDGRHPLVASPGGLPLREGTRPLKAWRYVGLYGAGVMLCAGRVRIGVVPQSFWAVWDREAGVLHERTSTLTRSVALPDGVVRVRARSVRIDLRLVPAGDVVEVRSPHGPSWIWTRKTPVRATGTITTGGRTRPVDGLALVDDSAGYHARRTAWEWSAGVGGLQDGTPVAWNLVAGVHDAVTASERTVWAGGRAREVRPVRFAPALDGVRFAEGGGIAFVPEAVRERHDALGPVRSDYVQPFGTFTGTLPGTGPLAEGFGVMERHLAHW